MQNTTGEVDTNSWGADDYAVHLDWLRKQGISPRHDLQYLAGLILQAQLRGDSGGRALQALRKEWDEAYDVYRALVQANPAGWQHAPYPDGESMQIAQEANDLLAAKYAHSLEQLD